LKVRQAELVNGKIHTITWIPAKLCKKSQVLLHDTREWIVLCAYKFELEVSDITLDWKDGGV